MYCEKCGKEIKEGEVTCSNCNNQVTNINENVKKPSPLNGLKTTAMVFGIVGLVLILIPVLSLLLLGIAFILGLIYLFMRKKVSAGLIIGIIGLIISGYLHFMLFKAVDNLSSGFLDILNFDEALLDGDKEKSNDIFTDIEFDENGEYDIDLDEYQKQIEDIFENLEKESE